MISDELTGDSENSEPTNQTNMPYSILGEDHSSDLDKLEKYTGVVDWSYLRPHYKNDALLWVDPEMDLTVVGKAFADDDKQTVQTWMKTGDIIKPGSLHAFQWDEGEWYFKALVVSPFVLIQPADKEE